MKKVEDFLKKLEGELASLPREERIEVLVDQREYFASAIESGRTEEDILQEFGDARSFAREILAESSLTGARKTTNLNEKFKLTWKAAWLTILLTPLNLLLVWIPFVILLLLMFSGWLLIFSGVVISLGLLLGFFIEVIFISTSFAALSSGLFALLGGLCFSICLLSAQFGITKFLFSKAQEYIRWNLKVIKGRS